MTYPVFCALSVVLQILPISGFNLTSIAPPKRNPCNIFGTNTAFRAEAIRPVQCAGTSEMDIRIVKCK